MKKVSTENSFDEYTDPNFLIKFHKDNNSIRPIVSFITVHDLDFGD